MPIKIICRTGNSGLTDYTVSLARALSVYAPVEVITNQNFDDRFAKMGFKVRRTFGRARLFPLEIWKLLALLFENPTTIVFQSWLLFPILELPIVWLLRMRGHFVAITVHDTLPHHPRPWSKAELSLFYRAFDALVAHSDAARNALIEMGVTKPILVVPHGNYDLFVTRPIDPARSRMELGLPPAPLVLLFFGHIDTRKGCLDFIALAESMRHDARLHFFIAGNNELSGDARDRLESARALPNLTIHDTRVEFEAVQSVFAASDVVVLPYHEGTTSGVFKLGMTFGKLVMATEIGDLVAAISAGTAVSLGTPNEIIPKGKELLARVASEGTAGFSSVLKALETERRELDWTTIAGRYWSFLSSARRTNDSLA